MKATLLFLGLLFPARAGWAQVSAPHPAATAASVVLPTPATDAPERPVAEYRALLPTYDAALKTNPRDVATLRLRALTHLRLRQYQEAVDDYTRVVMLRAATGDDFLRRAEARQALHDFKGTSDDLTNVLRFRPGDITTLMARGLTRMHQNDFPGATRDFTRIIATVRPPSHADSLALAALGADLDAEKPKRPVPRRPLPRTGRASTRAGAMAPAATDTVALPPVLTNASQMTANTSQLAQAYKYRGIAFVALYEYKRGCQDIQQAVELLPNDPEMQQDVQRYCPK